MAELYTGQCCGIKELDGVETSAGAKETVLGAAEDWFNDDDNQGAFIYFSTTQGDKGQNLAKYIKAESLGVVRKTSAKKNPNTGNMLTMWVWEVDKTALRVWWAKNNPDVEDEDENDDDSNW